MLYSKRFWGVSDVGKLITVLEVLLPIALAMALGAVARKRGSISKAGVEGMQKFVLNVALPFALFNSCLTGSFSGETLLPMGFTFLVLLISTLMAFRLRKRIGYSNLPMAFAAGEAGMIGLPLYMTLFPAEHTFRFAALQLIHLATAMPTLSILTAEKEGGALDTPALIKKVFTTPILVGSLLGLAVNLSGGMRLLEHIGFDTVLTKATSFMAAPVSAVIVFVIGYTFDLSGEDLRAELRASASRLLLFTLFCLMLQGALFFMPDVAPETRWAVLLYYMLPAPYTMPALGKTDSEQSFGSGVCSIGTVITLTVFCVMTVLTR